MKSLVLGIFICFSLFSHAQINVTVTNIAGNGDELFVDTAPSLECGFNKPTAMAVDTSGNIYFATSGTSSGTESNIYKMVKETGKLELFFESDGGLNGLAIDAENNIYFSRSDLYGGRYIVRFRDGETDPDTIAGNGDNLLPPDSGLATDNPIKNAAGLKISPDKEWLYYIGYGGFTNYIQKINLNTFATYRVMGQGDYEFDYVEGVPATNAGISVGLGLSWDNEDVLYFTTQKDEIKKIVYSSLYGYNIIEHVAGTGDSGDANENSDAKFEPLNISLGGITISKNNILYVCEDQNHKIKQIKLTTDGSIEKISTFAGSGYEHGDSDSDYDDLENFDEDNHRKYADPEKVNMEPIDMLIIPGFGFVFSDISANRIRRVFDCNNADLISVSIEEGLEYCRGDMIEIKIEGELNSALFWQAFKDECEDGESVAISNTNTLTIEIKEDADYYVRATGGCEEYLDCEILKLRSSCKEYFNTFTPNGDGKNDFFEIPILNKYLENNVKIYNRWGDLIREIENYDNEINFWDGTTVDHGLVDSGTYFFTAETEDDLITSGWIEVIK